MTAAPIRVLIADDEPVFRRVIRESLEGDPVIEVVAEAGDGEDAIELSTEHAPHVVLMDIRMPKLSGIEATRIMHDLHPSTKILMLTVSDDEADLFDAIKAGACGYLLKDDGANGISDAVHQISAGEAPMSTGMATKLMAHFAQVVRHETHPFMRPLLTNPELKVLRHLKDGMSSEQTATELGVTPGRVNTHLYNLLLKLHRHARMEIVIDEFTSEVDAETDLT